MKLKVLAGSKVGTEIPIKRSKFLIGRSSECTLRAGSDAISRRHCLIRTTEQGVTIRDLGSRNGTVVNGKKITGETPLGEGDNVVVGPLEFEVLGSPQRVKAEKKPKVKSVAEVIDRSSDAATKSGSLDDDISRWLLGPEPTPTGAMKETTSFKVDETRTTISNLPKPDGLDDQAADDGANEPQDEEKAKQADESDDNKKKEKKPKYGKLPSLPPKPSAKDSREAAADILREMSRRR